MDNAQPLEYVGFWIRVVAHLIDSLLVLIIILPLLISIYGPEYLRSEKFLHGPADLLLSYVFPAIAVLLFWSARQATPGKMAFKVKIVDANHGGKPSMLQYVVRLMGYIVSILPVGLGLLWVVWDRRKQAWHDKLASTVVVRPRRATNAAEVSFPDLERSKAAPADDTA